MINAVMMTIPIKLKATRVVRLREESPIIILSFFPNQLRNTYT